MAHQLDFFNYKRVASKIHSVQPFLNKLFCKYSPNLLHYTYKKLTSFQHFVQRAKYLTFGIDYEAPRPGVGGLL